MPVTGLRARDYDAKETAKNCKHETTSHGGNAKAFWVQCSRCRLHLEYYARRDTHQMVEVDQYMLDWEEKLQQEKVEAKVERERIKHEMLQIKDRIKTEKDAQRTEIKTARRAKTPPRVHFQAQPVPTTPPSPTPPSQGWEAVETIMIEENSPKTKTLQILDQLEQQKGANQITTQLANQMREHLGGMVKGKDTQASSSGSSSVL